MGYNDLIVARLLWPGLRLAFKFQGRVEVMAKAWFMLRLGLRLKAKVEVQLKLSLRVKVKGKVKKAETEVKVREGKLNHSLRLSFWLWLRIIWVLIVEENRP